MTGVAKIDVVDFDMCLMATFETVSALSGLAATAVFSEELVPGDGSDYREIIRYLQANAAAPTRTIAAGLVDAFFAGYQTNSRVSLTKSAVDVDAAGDLFSKTEAFFQLLKSDLPQATLGVAQSAYGAQRYKLPYQKDFANLLDSLRPRLSTPALVAARDQLRQALVSPTFLLRSRYRNGTPGYGDSPVERSGGLAITLPSGEGEDAFRSSGPTSFAAYATQVASPQWVSFLQTYLTSLNRVLAVRDLGNQRLQYFQVWGSLALSQGAEVDMVSLQPNILGDWDVYSPVLGSVTPNGVLTADSYDSNFPIEGFVANRYVRTGRYYFLALLYDDPLNARPRVNALYRNSAASPFTFLYATGTEPQLSGANSFLDDPTPTEDELFANVYSDLKVIATWDVTPSGSAPDLVASMPWSAASPVAGLAPDGASSRPGVTSEELTRLQGAVRQRRNARQVVPLSPDAAAALQAAPVPR